MLEFKLNYYFEKYKDHVIGSVTKFKKDFIKNEGEFKYLQEVVVMVMKYQINKYGYIIDGVSQEILGKGVRFDRENGRTYMRFGSKEERNKRNLKRKWEDIL